MYSSVKFLVASRIAGLPLPGNAAVAPDPPPLEPQPVRASSTAASAIAALFTVSILTGSLGRHHLRAALGHRAQRRTQRLWRIRDRQFDVDREHVEPLSLRPHAAEFLEQPQHGLVGREERGVEVLDPEFLRPRSEAFEQQPAEAT